ncbi:hypothetical protein DFP73DRAFT_561514 [Morchella snyderi]|nr:hypothetical protein DFP73DRAFT_561514 [Morchella snyderi]
MSTAKADHTMASPSPTPHECTQLLQGNFTILLKLLNSAKWDRMTEDQQNSVLHILKVTAETSYNLSEIAHFEALSRNASVGTVLVKAGKADREGTRVEAGTNTTEGAGEYALEQRDKMKFELQRAALECDRVKAETAKLAAETEKLQLEMEELKVHVESGNGYGGY